MHLPSASHLAPHAKKYTNCVWNVACSQKGGGAAIPPTQKM